MSDTKKDELKAKQIDARLDQIVDSWFQNQKKETAPKDQLGVDQPMISPVVEEVEFEDTEEEVETFLVQQDGQVTSEPVDKEEVAPAKSTDIPTTSLMEKAIYNKALKTTYSRLNKLRDVVASSIEGSRILPIRSAQSKVVTQIDEMKSQLNRAGLSMYSSAPNHDINIDKIKEKSLKEEVQKEAENITSKLIGGIK